MPARSLPPRPAPPLSTCREPSAAPHAPRSPPLRSVPALGENPSGSGAGLSPGAELAAARRRRHGQQQSRGSGAQRRLGRRSGGMRRGRAAGLAALAALLIVAVARAEIEQKPLLETAEGTGINITCKHTSIRTGETIYWYRQLPEKGPELLVFTVRETKDLPDNAGKLLVSADRSSSSLWLAEPRRGDAAVYYCALSATGRGAGAAAGHEPPRAGPGGASRGRCRSASPGSRAAPPQLLPLPRARGTDSANGSQRPHTPGLLALTLTPIASPHCHHIPEPPWRLAGNKAAL
ncbi:uncharacterized protein GJ701_015626 [Geothlypis trichas]